MAKQKVPGGKLLCIKVDYAERINSIEILGDFFLYPEESLADVEASLVGIGIHSSKEEIASRVSRVVKAKKIEMIGINPDAIAETVLLAVRS